MRIGILGGTFDPVHLGHLRSAEEITEKLALDKAYLVPSASPPHKTRQPVASFQHRMHMTRLGAGDSPLLEVLDLEGKRPGLSYSIETLQELRRLIRPEPELFFLLGTDAFLEIQTWKDYLRLFEVAHFVILERPGRPIGNLAAFLREIGLEAAELPGPGGFLASTGNELRVMSPTRLDISSTHIRALLAKGRSIRYLVPETVRCYIHDKGLYQEHGNPG